MSFDAFLEAAWRDHGDRPEEVARRLEEGYALIESPAQVAAFARILAHVDGEHCARWRDGVARLVRLRGHRLWNEDSDAPVVVRRLIAALELAGGGQAEPGLDEADRAHAHAVASAALNAQGRLGAAIRHLRAANTAAASGIREGDPAVRALAVASNNLAAALEEKSSRDDGETRAMLDAAASGRAYWARAGTWLEVERAEYLLAKCHVAAGDGATALVHAARCVELCAHNDADAFERFFAQSALAFAHTAVGDTVGSARAKRAALEYHATLADDLKSWCEATLRCLA